MSVRRGGGFRVSVDLSRYYPAASVRARCWLWVPAAGQRRVRWLAARLRRLFALHGQLALATAGHLLPDDEPLALLRPHDTLQVIPIDDEQEYDTVKEVEEIDGVQVNQTEEVKHVRDINHAEEFNHSEDVNHAEEANNVVEVSKANDKANGEDEEERLLVLKRRALSMLERYEHDAMDTGERTDEHTGEHTGEHISEHTAHRTRRRRTRKRRRTAHGQDARPVHDVSPGRDVPPGCDVPPRQDAWPAHVVQPSQDAWPGLDASLGHDSSLGQDSRSDCNVPAAPPVLRNPALAARAHTAPRIVRALS